MIPEIHASPDIIFQYDSIAKARAFPPPQFIHVHTPISVLKAGHVEHLPQYIFFTRSTHDMATKKIFTHIFSYFSKPLRLLFSPLIIIIIIIEYYTHQFRCKEN